MYTPRPKNSIKSVKRDGKTDRQAGVQTNVLV